MSGRSSVRHVRGVRVPTRAMIRVGPFCATRGGSFFERCICLRVRSVLTTPVSEGAVFERQALGSGFFNGLAVCPSKRICTGIGYDMLKGVRSSSLGRLLCGRVARKGT